MYLFERLFFTAFYGFIVYFWNKYAVTHLVKSVVKMNNNEWLSRNEVVLIKAFQGFFWTGFVMFVIIMIISLFK